MSQPAETAEPVGLGRGAQRRRSAHERRKLDEARSWLRKPGVVIFLCALVLTAGGWVLLIRAVSRLPVREAEADGLHLHFQDATWISDQMEHGVNFQKPASMMPDMPEEGKQRVSVTLDFDNRADGPREFHDEEFWIVPEIGDQVPPFGGVVGEARLEPGQTLNAILHFDVDTVRPHGRLVMKWQRGRHTAFFPIPDPPAHFHLRPRGSDVALPQDARLLLPLADAARGEQLFKTVYGCSACHGDPKVPDSNNIGPDLGGIGIAAAQRIPGKPAAQYIYESILQPDAFIAPACKNGAPCQTPSAMPDYGSLVNLQDAADLLGFLLAQQRPQSATTSPATAAPASAGRKGP
jgi:cytochrome c553